MRFPGYVRMDKVASKDKSRPVLTHAFLRIEEKDGERSGWLEATDSYKLARIQVEVDDADSQGFVPLAALDAARVAKTYEVEVNGGIVAKVEGGQLSLEQPNIGDFPDTEKLIPTADVVFEVGVNPTFLKELAEAFGSSSGVRLRFSHPGKPILVTPLSSTDAIGVLMPVRLT